MVCVETGRRRVIVGRTATVGRTSVEEACLFVCAIQVDCYAVPMLLVEQRLERQTMKIQMSSRREVNLMLCSVRNAVEPLILDDDKERWEDFFSTIVIPAIEKRETDFVELRDVGYGTGLEVKVGKSRCQFAQQ